MTRIYSVMLSLALAAAALAIQACDANDRTADQRAPSSDKETQSDVKKRVQDALAAVKNYTYDHKDEYVQKLQTVLDDVNARIADLKKQAAQAGAEARERLQPQIDELRRKSQVVQERLEKVKAASPAIWDDIKSGVHQALEDLQKAFEKARSHANNGK